VANPDIKAGETVKITEAEKGKEYRLAGDARS
jgi:hypothetical protein